MFQFGLYRVLIIQLGVLFGFYIFNVHKYNFGNLTTSEQTKLCAPPAISGAPLGGARTPGCEPLVYAVLQFFVSSYKVICIWITFLLWWIKKRVTFAIQGICYLFSFL